MKSVLKLIIRSGIVFLFFLPMIVPTVSHPRPVRYVREITLVTDQPLSERSRSAQREEVRRFFGQESIIKIEDLRSSDRHPLLRHEDIGQVVSEAFGTVVLDLQADLWGDAAQTFNKNLRRTRAAVSQSLYRLSTEPVFSARGGNAEISPGPSDYLIIASVYVPQVTFLGEETLASVEIVGRLDSNQKQQIELVVRSNTDLVTTARRTIQSDDRGWVREVVKLPLSFLKARTQVLTVSLQAPQAFEPLNQASTTVFVAHSKTTALHVAVGPDWSLRNIRQKLKFWPNLDLLSYYILRERWDENLIHTSQLSLIEFPSEKLFGEQLPNFHGIIAQNFYFDHYLRQEDALNLVNYVRKGGRMYIHPGPLSFLSDDPAIRSIFPCKDKPRFISDEQSLSWKIPTQAGIELPVDLASSLAALQTSQYFAGCDLREDTYVLAELSSGEPVLLASQLDKGLVITSLSADWHTQSTRADLSTAARIAHYNLANTAVEKLTQWIIEFVQRRQDSGLRPPDLLGPRLFVEDDFLAVRTRGATRQSLSVQVAMGVDGGVNKRSLTGRIVTLSFLEKQGLQLSAPLASLLPTQPNSFEAQPVGGVHFHPLSLSISGSQQAIQTVRRGGTWPTFSRRGLVVPPNPELLAGIPLLGDSRVEDQVAAPQQLARSVQTEQRPILEAYPWLLALGLALLALDTYVSRITLPSAHRPRSQGGK